MTIKFAGKLNAFSRGPRGFFVKLEIGGDDDWQELAAAPLGTSFGVVMVAIDPETGHVPEASPGAAKLVEVPQNKDAGQQRGEAGKPRRPFHEKSRAEQAGILCNDPQFLAWVGVKKYGPATGNITTEDAAEYIRNRCGVMSRADIDHPVHLHARQHFDAILVEYRIATGQMAEQR